MSVITDPLFYLLAIPAITILGIGKGGFSGIGMIATPLMALVLPPLQAAAIVQPILVVQDAISAYVYRRHFDAWNLKVLIVGGVIGVGLAWLVAVHVSDAQVRIMVGTIGVAFVLYTWLGRIPAEPKRPQAVAGVFWGAMTGITSTLAQAGAPPFQVFMLPQKLDKLTLVGTTLIFFAALNWMKLVPYFALGQFTAQNLADLGAADAARDRGELPRHLAGAAGADRDVLQDRLCADVPDLAGIDPERRAWGFSRYRV